jgi:hypothetical protein
MKFIEIKDFDRKYDTIVLFISHEERSIEFIKKVKAVKESSQIYVLFNADYSSFPQENNLQYLKKKFPNNIHFIKLSIKNSLAVMRFARNLDWEGKTLIDITGFNRGNLFPFLWASKLGKIIFPDLQFAYVSPKKYGNWLARDYNPAKNLIGFSGDLEFAQDRLLICLVGYEIERAINVIKASEPSGVILTVGTIPTKDEFLQRNKNAVNEVYGSTNYKLEELDVSDPESCFKKLLSIYHTIGNRTATHIAPFNTKISCLSVWALWLFDDTIRLWNSQPATYNTIDYSKGIDKIRTFNVEWE